MVRRTLHLSIGQELRLTQRPKIKDARQMVLVTQTLYISVRSVVQMRSTQDTMRTHLPAIGSRHAA